ncbi:MAG: CoA-transferase, partial [Candidatus Binatus sp.]|nr:CoA-transferase [Candidatus Binatus sp.]
AAALTEQFDTLDRGDALATLSRHQVPATPVSHFKDLFDDPQIAANDLIAELPHSDWGNVKQVGLLTKFSATPGRIDRAAPTLGEHSDEILREYLGYQPEKIAALRARRIVK